MKVDKRSVCLIYIIRQFLTQRIAHAETQLNAILQCEPLNIIQNNADKIFCRAVAVCNYIASETFGSYMIYNICGGGVPVGPVA